MGRILVVDDDALVRNSFARLFSEMGHESLLAGSLAEGAALAESGVDVIYLDLDLPDGDGLKRIDSLSASPGSPEIIIITGVGPLYGARESMQSGAWEYITKPATPQAIKKSLTSALEYRASLASGKEQDSPSTLQRCGIMGEDASTLRMLEEIEKAAKSDAGVLILGETGVGKELAARAVHENSARKDKPFVVVDCSNMTTSLVESMLYGHTKGAFTGAHADRRGLVAEADGGTLFLDEVGELSLSLQKTFLRVLQERRFRAVGSGKEQKSDFRLVAATNRDLDGMARRGLFRSDLLFRIRTMEIVMMPLRKRGTDIELLAEHCIDTCCKRYELAPKRISDEFLAMLRQYHWPGNIRELVNVMEAVVVQSSSAPCLYPKHLPGNVRLSLIGSADAPFEEPRQGTSPGESATAASGVKKYKDYKYERDKDYFMQLIRESDYDVRKASRLSGLSVPSVYRHLSLYEIPTRK